MKLVIIQIENLIHKHIVQVDCLISQKKINEILDQEEKEIFDYKNAQNIELHETGISQSIGKYF